MKISVCYIITEGWVKQHPKQEVLEEFKIPLVDINQPPYSQGSVVLYLNNQRDLKKFKNDNSVSSIVLTISQNKSFLSNFIQPSTHYNEDTPLPEKATMYDLKIAFKRLKRVRILYIKMIKTIFQTFFWIYPEFSKICMVFFCILVLFLPGQYFLPLFFFCVFVFCLLMNPNNKEILYKVNKMFFSKKKHMKPIPRIKTIKEATHLKKCQINILKDKAEEGVIKRWKKFKEDAVELQNYLMLIACYGEKFRQLFL